MIDSRDIISACLLPVALLVSTVAIAGNDSAASPQPVPPASATKQSGDETRLRIGSGDPVAGKGKAALCFGCHGEDGNSVDPTIPKLAGQYGIYISKQMRNYLASTRSHQVMSGMAGSVSDEDLADISAYFASQPIMKGVQPSGNKLGKKLFENDDLSRMMVRCNSCHGPTGKGLEPGNPVYPVIGGQHKEYLLAQLISFRKGARNNSPGGIISPCTD